MIDSIVEAAWIIFLFIGTIAQCVVIFFIVKGWFRE